MSLLTFFVLFFTSFWACLTVTLSNKSTVFFAYVCLFLLSLYAASVRSYGACISCRCIFHAFSIIHLCLLQPADIAVSVNSSQFCLNFQRQPFAWFTRQMRDVPNSCRSKTCPSDYKPQSNAVKYIHV